MTDNKPATIEVSIFILLAGLIGACGVEYVDHERGPIGSGHDAGCDSTPSEPEAPGPCPSMTITPDALAFGDVAVGSTATIAATVTNDGGTDAVLSYVGGPNFRLCANTYDPSVFCIEPNAGAFDASGGLTIPTASSVSLHIRFTPIIDGTRERGDTAFELEDASSSCTVEIRADGLGT